MPESLPQNAPKPPSKLQPYQGLRLHDPCPLLKTEKGKTPKQIKNCECAGCIAYKAFLKNPSSASGCSRRAAFLPIAAVLGVVTAAIQRVTSGQWIWENSSQPPQPSPRPTAEIPEEEKTYQSILHELEADEKAMQHVIDIVEGDLMNALKKVLNRTMPPELNKKIASIIAVIETTRGWRYKNRYTTAVRFFKEDNGNTAKKQIKEYHMKTGDEWLRLIDSANQWKLLPPVFSYRFVPNKKDISGEYDPASGTLAFSRGFSYQTLVERMMVFHELTHVVQVQEDFEGRTPDEMNRFKKNFIMETPAGEKLTPPIYFLDWELDAYATCFEIGDLIVEGGFRKLVFNNLDHQAKVIKPKTSSDEAFIRRLVGSRPHRVIDDAVNLAIPYFGGGTRYPNTGHELSDKIDDRKKISGKVSVVSEELFKMPPPEFQKEMWRRAAELGITK